MGSLERTRQDRRDIADTSVVAASGLWRAIVAGLAVAAVITVVSIGVWWFKVATSDAKGAGDATRITNDGRNRVNAQEWFHSQYATIKTADRNLDEAAGNIKTSGSAEDKEFWRVNYTGLKNRCVDMVNAYNAEAQKVSRGQWRDPALPFQIDGNDPATDCHESAQPSPR